MKFYKYVFFFLNCRYSLLLLILPFLLLRILYLSFFFHFHFCCIFFSFPLPLFYSLFFILSVYLFLSFLSFPVPLSSFIPFFLSSVNPIFLPFLPISFANTFFSHKTGGLDLATAITLFILLIQVGPTADSLYRRFRQ